MPRLRRAIRGAVRSEDHLSESGQALELRPTSGAGSAGAPKPPGGCKPMSAVNLAAPNTARSIWDDLVAELPVGVMLQDEHGSVLAANKLAASLLGLTREDLLRGRRPARWR